MKPISLTSPRSKVNKALKAASTSATQGIFNTFNRDWVYKMVEQYGNAGYNAIIIDAKMKCLFSGNIPADQTSCIIIGQNEDTGKDTANIAKKILLKEGSWVINKDGSIRMKTHNTKRNEFTNKYKHFKYEIDTNKSLKTLVRGLKIALLQDNLGVQKRMLGIEKTNNRRTPTDIVACEETARHRYDAFRKDYMTTVFLGVKSAGKILGKSRSTGARYLKMLEQEGYTRKKNKFKLGSMDDQIFKDLEADWTGENKYGRMFHSSTGLATLVFADSWTWNKQQPVAHEKVTAEQGGPAMVKGYDLQGVVCYYDPVAMKRSSERANEEARRIIDEYLMTGKRYITC